MVLWFCIGLPPSGCPGTTAVVAHWEGEDEAETGWVGQQDLGPAVGEGAFSEDFSVTALLDDIQ